LKKKVINAICANRNGNPKLSRRGIVKDILVVSSLKNNKKNILLVLSHCKRNAVSNFAF